MRSRHSLLFSEVAPHFPSERLEKAGIWSWKLTAKRERGLGNSWPRPSGELHRGSDQRRTGRRAAASSLRSMRGKRQREAPGGAEPSSIRDFIMRCTRRGLRGKKKKEWLWKLRDYAWKDGAKGKDRESRVPVFQFIGSSRSLMSFVKKKKKKHNKGLRGKRSDEFHNVPSRWRCHFAGSVMKLVKVPPHSKRLIRRGDPQAGWC